MSTTGNDVHDALPIDDSLKNATDTLVALKLAVSRSWPKIKFSERASDAFTLSANTFEYSLAAVSPAIPPDQPPARVYINESNVEPGVIHRNVRSYYDQSAGGWVLIFAPGLVSEFSGLTGDVDYQYPHPAITSLNDIVYLPDDYLVNYCAYWYVRKLLSAQDQDSGHLLDLMITSRNEWMAVLKENSTPLMPVIRSVGADRMRP